MNPKQASERAAGGVIVPERLALKDVVTPDRVRLAEDPMRVLVLHVDDREHRDVEPVLAFPMSQKADYVSFMGRDGKEAALLAHADKLDDESLRVLKACLERVYYVPKIQRVDSIAENHSVSRWNVLTDRGYASFEVVDSENIRRLPGGAFLICDADGNRYEIESIHQLDPRSRVLLESET